MLRDYNGLQATDAFEVLKDALKDRPDEFEVDGSRDYGRTACAYRKSDKTILYVARWYYPEEGEEPFCLEPSEVSARLRELNWI